MTDNAKLLENRYPQEMMSIKDPQKDTTTNEGNC